MKVRDILKALVDSKISMDEAEHLLSLHSIEYVEDLARLDVNRELRRGIPEVVYAEGKDYDDLLRIVKAAVSSKDKVIISRIKHEHIDQLVEELSHVSNVKVSKKGRIIVAYRSEDDVDAKGSVGVITAGTSDIAVAEEVRVVAEAMNCNVITSYDAGVAGIHRLFPILKEVISKEVDAIVVVAGMEGTLPSVVAALVDIPVIGVPTSIGYGLGANGVGALTSMLQSCTLGLAVMNIDNGVGAGAFAAMIANRVARYKYKDKNKYKNKYKNKIKIKDLDLQ